MGWQQDAAQPLWHDEFCGLNVNPEKGLSCTCGRAEAGLFWGVFDAEGVLLLSLESQMKLARLNNRRLTDGV